MKKLISTSLLIALFLNAPLALAQAIRNYGELQVEVEWMKSFYGSMQYFRNVIFTLGDGKDCLNQYFRSPQHVGEIAFGHVILGINRTDRGKTTTLTLYYADPTIYSRAEKRAMESLSGESAEHERFNAIFRSHRKYSIVDIQCTR